MGSKERIPSLRHPKGIKKLMAIVLMLTIVISSVVHGQIFGVVYMSKTVLTKAARPLK